MNPEAQRELEYLMRTPLEWRRTADPLHPWEVEIDGHIGRIRVNDFPAEPLYSLLIDGGELGSFDDWPPAWKRS